MTGARVAFACLVAVCLTVATAAPGQAATPRMVVELNKNRQANGLPPLRYSSSLGRSSTSFARHLDRTNRFGHASRIWASSRFRRLGEVLGLQRGWRVRRAAAIRMWMRSPGHRAHLLSRAYRYIGASRVRGRMGGRRVTIWVVQLGAR